MSKQTMGLRECRSPLFYPHIKWRELCTATFMGYETTIFCKKCSERIRDMHRKRPGFKSKGIECARPECLKLFIRIENRRTKYCEECKGIVHREQMRKAQAVVRAENKRIAAINAKKPAYTSGHLQRLRGDRLARVVTSILRGESIIT